LFFVKKGSDEDCAGVTTVGHSTDEIAQEHMGDTVIREDEWFFVLDKHPAEECECGFWLLCGASCLEEVSEPSIIKAWIESLLLALGCEVPLEALDESLVHYGVDEGLRVSGDTLVPTLDDLQAILGIVVGRRFAVLK
jgi:hypothetical protein